MIGKRMIGRRMIGRRMIGRRMIGRRMIGRRMIGRRMIGRRMIGKRMADRRIYSGFRFPVYLVWSRAFACRSFACRFRSLATVTVRPMQSRPETRMRELRRAQQRQLRRFATVCASRAGCTRLPWRQTASRPDAEDRGTRPAARRCRSSANCPTDRWSGFCPRRSPSCRPRRAVP